ncbi:MAG: hypothetical protein CL840_05490 [Crocinitomicaceae bacterium]|nr:hypothetical protein [Crocinitomicaceae bacterium]|tara:strand:+ start:7212 stop:8696 length:1485 start_codon:yes stop_codon:yes gene_type:complete
MSRIVFVFLLFLSLTGFSQTYFNELYDVNNSADAGSNVLETDSNYIITGAIANTNGTQEFAIQIIDKAGNRKRNKSYSYGFTKAVRYGQTIVLSNGQIADFRTLQEYDSGAQNYRTWPVLTLFNSGGDKLWSKQYKDPNIFWLAAQAVVETPDSGFVLVTDKKISDSSNNPVLIRIDKDGKELYRKEIKTNRIDKLYSAAQYITGGYVFGGGGNSTGISVYNSLVIKTTDSLDVIWKYYGNFQIGAFSKATVLRDSAIINSTDSIYSSGKWSFKRITKLDSNGQENWAKHYENGQENARFSKTVELLDGSLVVYGEHNNGRNASLRTLTKLTADGDTIWSNLYYYDSPNDQNYLRDFIATRDGGFLLGGDVSPRSSSQGQDLWLLKVDSNGCSTPDCKSRVYDVRLGIDYRKQMTTEFRIFPNPVVDQFTVQQQGETSKQEVWNYKIVSTQGKELQSGNFTSKTELNISDVPSGVYLLKFEHGPVQKVYRVVKE